MSKLVVAWEDNKGNEYNATTLYDAETGEFYDWDYSEARYVKRLAQEKSINE